MHRPLPGHTSSRLSQRFDALLNVVPGRLRRRESRERTLICAACRLTGGPFEPAEAAFLIALHDDLHHGLRRPAAGHLSPEAFGRQT
jgi:hypothetical protein